MGDPQTYRPEEDQQAAEQRDSITRMEADLRVHGLDDEEISSMRDGAHERVEEAIAWAKEQPQPDPAAAHENAFVNPPSGVTDSEPDFAELGGDD